MSSLGIRNVYSYIGGNGIVINNGIISIDPTSDIVANSISLISGGSGGTFIDNECISLFDSADKQFVVMNASTKVFEIVIDSLKKILIGGIGVPFSIMRIFNDIVIFEVDFDNTFTCQSIRTNKNNPNPPHVTFDSVLSGVVVPNKKMVVTTDGTSGSFGLQQ